MKKILLLLILGLFMTGCTVDYRLDFAENSVIETINLTFDGDIRKTAKELSGDGFYAEKELVENEMPSLKNYKDYYNKKIDISNGKSIVTLNYQYTYDNLVNSYIANNCFEHTTFLNEEDSYYFSLQGGFLCFSNQNITIKISSTKKVLNHNADSFKNGYYIWNLDMKKDNYDIKFQISKKLLAKEKIKSPLNAFKIIVLVLLLMSATIFLVIKRKINNDV